jgi:PAS domain S-box-containing protein
MSRILIAEDSAVEAELLRSVLEGEGFEVVAAPDGERALDLLHASAFDLIITDIVMPGPSGYALCRAIKDDPATARLPVILLTALSDPLDIIQGITCGADNFLTKPFEPAGLVRRVRGLLATRALRAGGRLKVGIDVVFLGKTFTITSDKEQLLDLLIATCEDMVRTNRELRAMKAALERTNRRLRAEARSNGDRYRSLMQQAGEGIFVLDPQGTVLEVNRRAGEMLGYSPPDLVGRSFYDLVDADDRGSGRRRLDRLLQGGPPRSDHLRLRRADGGAVPVDLAASAAEAGGERVVLVLARDVTERDNLEEQLRQAQKMEAMGRLAGGVAHDFNNLLTVVTGYTAMLLADLPAGHSLRRPLAEIKQAADRGTSLTRQLLTFSRRGPVSPQVLDLNAVVTDMTGMLRRLIGEDLVLTTKLGSGLGRVRADPGQMGQVLLNLAVNARDAMPRGGTLTVETADAEVSRDQPALPPGRYVLLAATDTGSGMDEATRARIFEPFFTTKGPGRGTGLGLAVVHGVVQQAGGHIEVSSEPGAGTTFRVYLPRVTEPAGGGRAVASEAASPGGTETVLLVEDEAGVRRLARLILQAKGYTVLEAAHSAEALRLAREHGGPIHLLVADVVLPQMSGPELAARLRAANPALAVLFLSGYADDAVFPAGLREAEVAFLQKPFTPNALARRVREELGRVRGRDGERADPPPGRERCR